MPEANGTYNFVLTHTNPIWEGQCNLAWDSNSSAVLTSTSGVKIFTDYYVNANKGSDTDGTGKEDAPFATISKALSAMSDPNQDWRIIMQGDEFTNQNITIDNNVNAKSLTIEGQPVSTAEGAKTKLMGNGGTILTIKSSCAVNLKNLCFSNTNGKGLSIEVASVMLTDCDVTGNTNGGISIEASSTATLTNCTVINNEVANSNGAGIYVSKSNLTLDNTSITNNTININVIDDGFTEHEYHGGGLYFNDEKDSDKTLTIKNNSIISDNNITLDSALYSDCTVWVRGVGAYVNAYGEVLISGGEIKNNKVINNSLSVNVTSYGGGLSIMGEDAKKTTVSGVEISDNSGVTYGGGVESLDTTLTNCNIHGNTAINGGGVCARSTTIQGGTITLNKAESNDTNKKGNGAGIYVEDTITMSNGCKVTDNTASAWGGGIYFLENEKHSSTITGCSIEGNKAGFAGGGIATGFNTTANNPIVELYNTTVNSNVITNTTESEGTRGAGIHIGKSGVCSINGTSEIKNNKFTQATNTYGGGISSNGYLTINGGTISGNSAVQSGGVYQEGYQFEMTGGEISGNTGNLVGGVALADGARFNMGGGTIGKNSIISNPSDVIIRPNVWVDSSTLCMCGSATINTPTVNDNDLSASAVAVTEKNIVSTSTNTSAMYMGYEWDSNQNTAIPQKLTGKIEGESSDITAMSGVQLFAGSFYMQSGRIENMKQYGIYAEKNVATIELGGTAYIQPGTIGNQYSIFRLGNTSPLQLRSMLTEHTASKPLVLNINTILKYGAVVAKHPDDVTDMFVYSNGDRLLLKSNNNNDWHNYSKVACDKDGKFVAVMDVNRITYDKLKTIESDVTMIEVPYDNGNADVWESPTEWTNQAANSQHLYLFLKTCGGSYVALEVAPDRSQEEWKYTYRRWKSDGTSEETDSDTVRLDNTYYKEALDFDSDDRADILLSTTGKSDCVVSVCAYDEEPDAGMSEPMYYKFEVPSP